MHTLEQLNSGALAGAREVRLTHQGLSHFPQALFDLADTLELLDLSGNQLSELPADLHRLHRLRRLFASDNPFTQLPRALGRCAALELVGFKACRIRDVPGDSLPPLLRWLILTDNQITHLPEALGQRPRLQKLMLACNQLAALPASLVDCTQLELLRIASNRFTAVPAPVLQLPRLAWLAMAGNPLTQKSELQALATSGLNPIFMPELQLHEVLGTGASGAIHRATRADGTALALKVFKAAHTSDGTPQSELAAGLAAGRHPQLLTPLAPVAGDGQGRLAMALPLLPADLQPLAGPPSLDSCTRDVYAPGLRLARAAAERLLQGITAAVAYLHGRGVLHGDLYAHNILWDAATGQALLSDFGAAMLLHELPPAQAAQLQAQELRALAHLQAEVRARTD